MKVTKVTFTGHQHQPQMDARVVEFNHALLITSASQLPPGLSTFLLQPPSPLPLPSSLLWTSPLVPVDLGERQAGTINP